LSAIGHFDEAILELERSIEAKPLQGEAYQALVFAKRVLPADRPLVDQMERLLSDSSLSESDRLNLMYSLGKAYDNLGEFERAIGFFDAANALKLKLEHVAPLDRKAFSALIDAKIEIFKKGETLVGKRFQSESSLPILVAGMMRSGTTLAEQMLSCHPMVGGAGEQSYWGENEASIIDHWGRTISTAALQICSREYGSLLAAISPGFPFVIDKNPANVQHLGSFHMAFPNAKIIVTRRDAVDTALSIWMTPLNTMAEFVCDRENIVFAYKECMRLMDHWREVLPADRYLEIRYEDLVANPEEHARKMVEFCGWEWDEKCLHPERNERRIRTPSMWQVRQPIYKSSTERWRKYEPWLGAFEQLRGLA
jgi:tetratricopeptide (TPR) repeat protein